MVTKVKLVNDEYKAAFAKATTGIRHEHGGETNPNQQQQQQHSGTYSGRPPTAEQFDSRRARRSDGRAVPRAHRRAHRFVCEGGVSWNSSGGVS